MAMETKTALEIKYSLWIWTCTWGHEGSEGWRTDRKVKLEAGHWEEALEQSWEGGDREPGAGLAAVC